jgi:hypothetical protein
MREPASLIRQLRFHASRLPSVRFRSIRDSPKSSAEVPASFREMATGTNLDGNQSSIPKCRVSRSIVN